MQAMILAAGLGTRLLPHTLIRPKPLFPILNQPLLLVTIQRLQNLGFDRIVVNCHHLRQQIVAALRGITGVVIQEEETILGTGGGLRRALPLLRDEPLLVTNGDIYHTIDIIELYEQHKQEGCQVTLAMHDCPRFNVVRVEGKKVTAFGKAVEAAGLAFTGLHVLDPAILAEIGDNTYSCIIDHYRTLLATGREIACFRSDGCYWTDMGTPGDYLALHRGLLTGAVPCWQELGEVAGPFCLGEKVKTGSCVHLRDWACIGGNVRIGNGCHLERVVVWDKVEIPAGSRLVDTICSTTA